MKTFAPKTQQAPRTSPEPVVHPAAPSPVLPRTAHTAACACGGGCPRCAGSLAIGSRHDPLEREADRVAEEVMAGPSAQQIHRAPAQVQRAATRTARVAGPAPRSVDRVLSSPGRPMPPGLQQGMSARFGHDFSHVRLHTGDQAEESARDVSAKAYTVGHNIVFGAGRYSPDTGEGRHLLAHELAHVVQQSGGKCAPYVARSVDDWLTGSVNVSAMSYTELLSEVDELSQFLARQTESSSETVRLEEALVSLRVEVNRREAATSARSRGRGRRRTTAPAASEAPLPDRYPRVLTEMTTVAYTDPAEMRTEYDLIMQWLARDEISSTERRILTAERDSLAPQLLSDRERVVAERHAARLTAALSPAGGDDARGLEMVARTIQGISPDPSRADIFYIYDAGEQIAISREQADQLRRNLRSELERAARSIQSRASYYWDRYNSQLAINRDSPIIAGISGWLADVEDPHEELAARYFWVYNRIRTTQELLRADRLVDAATRLPQVEFVTQEIRQLARAFYEGYIEGAETAVRRLEFTRDASFAIAGAIAAVVAAPVVAGFVGAGGLGATGIGAGILTTGGTGVVVGSGMAVVRGGSAAIGTGVAGGSLDEVGAALRSEAARGFREGFMSGSAGAAGRVLGPVMGRLATAYGPLAGVATAAGQQALARALTGGVVNGTAAMLDVLSRGGSLEQAAAAGLRSAALSVPGSLIGMPENPVARYLLAPLISGGTAYLGARASGVPEDQAMQAAGVAVATNLALTMNSTSADQQREAFGRSMGASVRTTATSAARTVAPYAAAIMVGVSDAVPPLRSGSGAPSVIMEGDLASIPAASAPASSVTPASPVVEAPAVAPAAAPAVAPAAAPATAPASALAPIAGAQDITMSSAAYTAALQLTYPSMFADQIMVLVDQIGDAAAIRAMANPRFVAAMNAGNVTLAGTFFHSAAAAVANGLPPGSLPPGWTLRAEDVVQAGAGGSRIDLLFRGPNNARIEVDWKTTGISALSTGSRAEMVRHQGQIITNLGGTLDAQQSRSWMQIVRSRWTGPWPF